MACNNKTFFLSSASFVVGMLFSFEINYKARHVFKIDKSTLSFIPRTMTVLHTSFLIHSTFYIYIVCIKIKEPMLTNSFFSFFRRSMLPSDQSFYKANNTNLYSLFKLSILYFLFLVLLKQLMFSLFLS
jgi:flagellar biosynthesis protein FliQ